MQSRLLGLSMLWHFLDIVWAVAFTIGNLTGVL